jgi:hypothetical protein
MSVRCVLSDGMRGPVVNGFAPTPASLFVVADLGHVFRGLGIDEQRRTIEAALTDALTLAFAKLDALHAADSPEVPCQPERSAARSTAPPSSATAAA